MIYWHVERKSLCIYSQLRACSSSEVAAMIEGLVRHCTDMTVERNYVDSHGQSEVAFAFCHLLGFQLLPRLKGIHAQKLYRPRPGQPGAYLNLQPVLTRPINWELIANQYDEMVKFATALRIGTAEAEAILRRFPRATPQHPTYQALAELGKAVKTAFLCDYLSSVALRREIHGGLNVVENWNSVNNFVFYGKGGEISSNQPDDQELSALSLHLLQSCLVYVNTLLIQRVLAEGDWADRLTQEDFRGITPLLYQHVNTVGSTSTCTSGCPSTPRGRRMTDPRTPARTKARQLAKHLRPERPDYDYLKQVFRHLRTELGIEIPRGPKRLPYVPTEEEIRRYYEVVWKARRTGDVIMIKTLLYTGVRVSELIGIRLDYVDFDRCQIRINRGKGDKDRVVPFPSTVVLTRVALVSAPCRGAPLPPSTTDSPHVRTSSNRGRGCLWKEDRS